MDKLISLLDFKNRLLIKDKIENYKECMILYISNLMYDAVFYGDKVNIKLLRKEQYTYINI